MSDISGNTRPVISILDAIKQEFYYPSNVASDRENKTFSDVYAELFAQEQQKDSKTLIEQCELIQKWQRFYFALNQRLQELALKGFVMPVATSKPQAEETVKETASAPRVKGKGKGKGPGGPPPSVSKGGSLSAEEEFTKEIKSFLDPNFKKFDGIQDFQKKKREQMGYYSKAPPQLNLSGDPKYYEDATKKVGEIKQDAKDRCLSLNFNLVEIKKLVADLIFKFDLEQDKVKEIEGIIYEFLKPSSMHERIVEFKNKERHVSEISKSIMEMLENISEGSEDGIETYVKNPNHETLMKLPIGVKEFLLSSIPPGGWLSDTQMINFAKPINKLLKQKTLRKVTELNVEERILSDVKDQIGKLSSNSQKMISDVLKEKRGFIIDIEKISEKIKAAETFEYICLREKDSSRSMELINVRKDIDRLTKQKEYLEKQEEMVLLYAGLAQKYILYNEKNIESKGALAIYEKSFKERREPVSRVVRVSDTVPACPFKQSLVPAEKGKNTSKAAEAIEFTENLEKYLTTEEYMTLLINIKNKDRNFDANIKRLQDKEGFEGIDNNELREALFQAINGLSGMSLENYKDLFGFKEAVIADDGTVSNAAESMVTIIFDGNKGALNKRLIISLAEEMAMYKDAKKSENVEKFITTLVGRKIFNPEIDQHREVLRTILENVSLESEKNNEINEGDFNNIIEKVKAERAKVLQEVAAKAGSDASSSASVSSSSASSFSRGANESSTADSSGESTLPGESIPLRKGSEVHSGAASSFDENTSDFDLESQEEYRPGKEREREDLKRKIEKIDEKIFKFTVDSSWDSWLPWHEASAENKLAKNLHSKLEELKPKDNDSSDFSYADKLKDLNNTLLEYYNEAGKISHDEGGGIMELLCGMTSKQETLFSVLNDDSDVKRVLLENISSPASPGKGRRN